MLSKPIGWQIGKFEKNDVVDVPKKFTKYLPGLDATPHLEAHRKLTLNHALTALHCQP